LHTVNSTEYIGLLIIIVLATFTIVISWINRNKKKKENENLETEFDHFAITNDLAIDKKKLNKRMIGIDKVNLILVFFNNSSAQGEFHLIELNDLSACRLIKQKNDSTGHISRIFLKCIFIQKNRLPIELPFYNEMEDNIFKMMRLPKRAYY